MLKLKKITVFLIVLLAVIFLLPKDLLAQTVNEATGVNDLANAGVNLGQKDLKEVIANIINIILAFLGVIAVVLFIYAGWLWMTAQGDAAKVEKAKKIMIDTTIGLAITLSAYAIASFILRALFNGTFGNNNGNGNGGGYHGGIGIGNGVIESHYPMRNAEDIPRNTNIYITFKEAMKAEDLVFSGGDCAYEFCAHLDNLILTNNEDNTIFDNNNLQAILSADKKILSLNPFGGSSNYLGSANQNTSYNFALANSIKKDNGDEAFGLNGYDWNFSVSEEIDLTPPSIVSVIPQRDTVNARNTIVQINFSESINPLSASGVYPDFTNVTVVHNSNILHGTYRIANQYQTVEFVTNDLCGTNSCGGNVYCLPADASLLATVTDNLTDMADNALDGDNNGEAGGDYAWAFGTNNTIDLAPPKIVSMEENTGIATDLPIQVTFNKSLMAASINSTNVNFVEKPNNPINYWLSVPSGKAVKISHDRLKSYTEYKSTLSSGIQDVYQNCFQPCVCQDVSGSSCVCDSDESPDCQAGQRCQGN